MAGGGRRMLHRGRILAERADREDLSPMEHMGNLVTVMVVFVCGLLISIIMNWNVSLDGFIVVLDEEQLVKIENPEEVTAQIQSMDDYGDVGKAVRDPKTGDIYIMEEEGEGAEGEAGEKEREQK